MPNIGVPELAFVALMFLMFVVVPATLILLLVRSNRRGSPEAETRDPAMDTLRTRFASGEIDETEYERLRSIMQRR